MGVGSWAHIGRNGGGAVPPTPSLPPCRLSEGRGYCRRYLPPPLPAPADFRGWPGSGGYDGQRARPIASPETRIPLPTPARPLAGPAPGSSVALAASVGYVGRSPGFGSCDPGSLPALRLGVLSLRSHAP